MRLIRIRPTYFRGFGASGWINLDADLVLVFGPNGFGKTSLAEAVEWLIYGKTLRRAKGNILSRLEYRGSYCNVHAPDGASTSVAAVIRLTDGSEHQVARVLMPGQYGDEDSELFIDGAVASFSSLGLEVREAFYPVIVQHGLQDFIHARPIDRRDAISEAFGLEPIVHFKDALEQARNSFRNSPPAIVSRAASELNDALGHAHGVAGVEGLVSRWRQNDFAFDADYAELLARAQAILNDGGVSPDAVIERLGQKRLDLAAVVFDIELIRPGDGHEELLRQIEGARTQATGAIRRLDTATEVFLRQMASVYTEELLRFWEQGLTLVVGRGDDLCPMCESPTLTPAKQDELRSRIEANQQYRDAHRALAYAITDAVREAQAESRAVAALTKPRMTDDQELTLRNLFVEDQNVVEPLTDAVDSCTQTKRDVAQQFSRLVRSLGKLTGNAEHSRARRHVRRAVVAMERRAETCAQAVIETWRAYGTVFAGVEEVIVGRISSNAAIREIDALLQLWNAKENVKVLSVYHRFIDETLDDLRAVEQFIQTKHREVFESRGAEVQSWYDSMCPGADVRYSGMEAATDAIKLYAESFGQRMNAAPCLSHSQLNCLGLGVYITRAAAPYTPFRFLVFDDPVQSMDDEHCESFMQGVIGRLLGDGGAQQVIVLSHLEGVTTRLHRLHNHHRLIRYKIDQFSRTGPSIVTYDPLETALREIQSLADGNEENRRLAVQKLRPAVERVVRELHVRETGMPLDESLATATAPELLHAFTQIPNTTPQEHQGFRDTVSFADPSHHTEDGWQVPTRPQILPHVDRLRQLARQKGLIV